MPPVTELTLMTWNLQGSRGVDVDQIAAYVRETGSDVLALQEVQRHQAVSLARALEAHTLSWGFKHWPLNTRPEGMALVGVTVAVEAVRTRAITRRWRLLSWRRRIAQTAYVTPRTATAETAATEAGRIRLVNVHLTPHREGATDRNRELRGILADQDGAAPQQPTILVGDFNAEPATAPIERMRAAGFTQAGSGPTNWRGTPSDSLPEQEIDYIWISDHLTLENVRRPRHGETELHRFGKISDHLPVTATVTDVSR